MSKVRHTVLLNTSIRDFLIGNPNSILIPVVWKNLYIIYLYQSKALYSSDIFAQHLKPKFLSSCSNQRTDAFGGSVANGWKTYGQGKRCSSTNLKKPTSQTLINPCNSRYRVSRIYMITTRSRKKKHLQNHHFM